MIDLHTLMGSDASSRLGGRALQTGVEDSRQRVGLAPLPYKFHLEPVEEPIARQCIKAVLIVVAFEVCGIVLGIVGASIYVTYLMR